MAKDESGRGVSGKVRFVLAFFLCYAIGMETRGEPWAAYFLYKGRTGMRQILCFHNPDERNGYLSNWYHSDFHVGKIQYSSMEQYMMYQKALLFNDMDIAEQILKTSNVGKIKALGRSVKNYEDITWNGMRQVVVYQGLLEKFRQNDELGKRLLATQSAILAECAVQDKIWGIGLSMKDERRFDLKEWQGQNLLGFSLMYVRAVLEQED